MFWLLTGLVFGVHENASDNMSILDPVNHTATQVKMPVLDEKMQPPAHKIGGPSPYCGSST